MCAGQPVSPLTRILLGWPEGIRPSPNATTRAALLFHILQAHPECLQLACYQNDSGVTPLHLCVQTASVAVLQVLVSTAQQVLGAKTAALLLSAPDFRGRSALDIAFASQQWDAAALLIDTAPLSHSGIRAALRFSEQATNRSRWQPGSNTVAPAGAGATGMIAGAVGGVLNKLWDSWGGDKNELSSVAQHRQEIKRAASGSRQSRQMVESHLSTSTAATSTAATSTGIELNRTEMDYNHNLHRNSTPGSKDFNLNSHFLPDVTVLGDASAVQQYRQDQIHRLSSTLGLSTGDAAAVLAKHGWDDDAAIKHIAETMQGTTGGREPVSCSSSSSYSAPSSTYDSIASRSSGSSSSSGNSTGTDSGTGFSANSGEHSTPLCRQTTNVSSEMNTSDAADVCLVCFEPLNSSPNQNTSAEWNSPADFEGMSPSQTSYGEMGPSLGLIGSRYLSCGHVTCDACWVGILEASPQAPCCPAPTCRQPLPLEAAKRLLPSTKYTRVASLVTDAYVAANPLLKWCPAAGCTTCLRLASGARNGNGMAASAAAAAAAGRGVDAQCSCGHASCWTCGQAAHEPATCAQALTWTEELAKLRAAAPVSDRRWLQRNARQCPGCGAFIQRTGGCNHMTCACGKHWCWECRRDWSEHNADTGGFYFCSLEEDDEAGSSSGNGSGNSSGNQGGGGGGCSGSGWLREVLRSVHNVASQAILQRALQMHLRHECDPAAVRAVGVHLQELSSKLKLRSGSCSIDKVEGTLDDQGVAKSGAGLIQRTSLDTKPLGPEAIGVSAAEAARMRPEEWAGCMAAACRSAAENGVFKPKFLPQNSANRSNLIIFAASEGVLDNSSASWTFLDAPKLAAVVIEAHATLQNAAAALRDLPGGARRRYLTELCDDSERWLAQVEPILMELPYQDVAVARAGSHPFFLAPFVAARGALASLIQGWKGVATPKESSQIPGLPAHVIVAQAHYLAALERQRGQVGDAAEALQHAVGAVKHAARSGLFSATND